jgi:hypothetical protein
MRSKWLRHIKRFIEIFTPGGVEYSTLGTEFHVSSNGTITVPASELQKILFKRLEEMQDPSLRLCVDLDQRDHN